MLRRLVAASRGSPKSPIAALGAVCLWGERQLPDAATNLRYRPLPVFRAACGNSPKPHVGAHVALITEGENRSFALASANVD